MAAGLKASINGFVFCVGALTHWHERRWYLLAIFHFSMGIISRKKGKSVVGAASYISGEKLYDRYYGRLCDNRRRQDVLYTEILLPPGAPSQLYDRNTFWNAVDDAEKRCDSRTARVIIMALPNELTHDEHILLVRTFILNNFVSLGMGADIAIHSGHRADKHLDMVKNAELVPDNPHAHVLLTTRIVGADGFNTKKERDWDKKEILIHWRSQWAQAQNQALERKGLSIRVSHESYVAQGVDKIPTKHLGRKVKALEDRGISTDYCNDNKKAIKQNRERDTKKLEKSRVYRYDREHSI